jgi:hypothetical protein
MPLQRLRLVTQLVQHGHSYNHKGEEMKLIMIFLALTISGCTVNLTSRHLESQLDDLTQRTQKSEQAHVFEQQNLQNLANMVGDLQRRLPLVEDKIKPKEEGKDKK